MPPGLVELRRVAGEASWRSWSQEIGSKGVVHAIDRYGDPNPSSSTEPSRTEHHARVEPTWPRLHGLPRRARPRMGRVQLRAQVAVPNPRPTLSVADVCAHVAEHVFGSVADPFGNRLHFYEDAGD